MYRHWRETGRQWLQSTGAQQIRDIFVWRIGAFVLSLASSVIIARCLGAERKGIFTAALLLPSMVAGFVHLGIPVSNVYYLNKRRNPATLLLNGAVFCFIVSTATLIIFAGMYRFGLLGKYYEGIEDTVIVMVALSTVILYVFNEFLVQILRGLHAYYVPIVSHVICDCLRLFTILALLYLVGISVELLIYVVVAALIIRHLYMVTTVLKKIPLSGARTSLSQFRESLGYGLRHFMGNVLNTLNTKIDLLVLAAFFEKRTLGVYAVAVGVSEMTNYLPSATGYVLYPKLAKETDNAKKREILRKCIISCLVILIPSWLVFLSIGKWLVVGLYGDEFSQAYLYASILMAGAIVLNTTVLLNKYFSGTGRPELVSLARALNLPIKGATLYVLCKYYGALGASLSFVLSSIMLFSITLVIYKKTVRKDEITVRPDSQRGS